MQNDIVTKKTKRGINMNIAKYVVVLAVSLCSLAVFASQVEIEVRNAQESDTTFSGVVEESITKREICSFSVELIELPVDNLKCAGYSLAIAHSNHGFSLSLFNTPDDEYPVSSVDVPAQRVKRAPRNYQGPGSLCKETKIRDYRSTEKGQTYPKCILK